MLIMSYFTAYLIIYYACQISLSSNNHPCALMLICVITWQISATYFAIVVITWYA